MANYTERFSEGHYPLVTEHADSLTAATYNTAYVSLQNYHRAVLFLDVGDMAQGATLDVSLRQAQDTAGTGNKAITGKAITQLTQAGGDGNQVLCIELQTEELDVENGFEHVNARTVVANAAVELSLTIFGIQTRYAPVPTTNWSEIIG